MEKRMIRAEQTMERHDSQIGKIFSKIDDQGESIHKIMNTMAQIKWTFYGAVGYFVISELGLIQALKIAA